MAHTEHFAFIDAVFVGEVAYGARDIGDVVHAFFERLAATFAAGIPCVILTANARRRRSVQIRDNKPALVGGVLELLADHGKNMVGVAHAAMKDNDHGAVFRRRVLRDIDQNFATVISVFQNTLRLLFDPAFGILTVFADLPPFLKAALIVFRSGGIDGEAKNYKT